MSSLNELLTIVGRDTDYRNVIVSIHSNKQLQLPSMSPSVHHSVHGTSY
jgi:hypothetical protein